MSTGFDSTAVKDCSQLVERPVVERFARHQDHRDRGMPRPEPAREREAVEVGHRRSRSRSPGVDGRRSRAGPPSPNVRRRREPRASHRPRQAGAGSSRGRRPGGRRASVRVRRRARSDSAVLIMRCGSSWGRVDQRGTTRVLRPGKPHVPSGGLDTSMTPPWAAMTRLKKGKASGSGRRASAGAEPAVRA